MRFSLVLAIGAMALTGCAPLAVIGTAQKVDAPVVSCDSHTGPGCSFDRAPLRVLPEPMRIGRPYEFFPTAERLTFVDAGGRQWIAPNRTLTDGASIPQIFVSIVGDPTSPEFINAAAMHDAYCGIGNEAGAMFHEGTWQAVHKMFYDGLVVSGVAPGTAKLMFAAVWLGGPRWETARTLDHVPASRKRQAMRQAKAYIAREEPSLGALIRFLDRLDTAMITAYAQSGGAARSQPPMVEAPIAAPNEPPYESPYEEPPYELPYETPYEEPPYEAYEMPATGGNGGIPAEIPVEGTPELAL
ncbi:DUF1353 domain-containing protein [Primorskyibacter sp. 2E107]|uniref:DUF1353 domain-containing protein n=1 Tax=Primorskyibacter sp. 2E107 TaxID=3403458 RepID=UPI003AF60091